MYPKVNKQPISEESLMSGKPDENSLSYAVAKLAGLQMCEAYNYTLKNQFITLIPNTVLNLMIILILKQVMLSALISRIHKAKLLDLDELQL